MWKRWQTEYYRCVSCNENVEHVFIAPELEGEPAVCTKCIFKAIAPHFDFRWKVTSD